MSCLTTAPRKKLTDAEIRKNRLHFGLVFQSFNLFPQYTALEKRDPRAEASGQEHRGVQGRSQGDSKGHQ